jgi:hypothetical protein
MLLARRFSLQILVLGGILGDLGVSDDSSQVSWPGWAAALLILRLPRST